MRTDSVADLIDVTWGHPSEWAMPGQHHWVFTNARELASPIPWRGVPGIMPLPASTADQIRAQLNDDGHCLPW